jgi:putative DNA primase/helicase
LRQKIEEASGRAAKAGHLVRMLDIPIHEGVVKDSHGLPPGGFVNGLKSACGRFYGTAGHAFLERLVTCEQDTQSLQRRIQHRVDHYSAHLAYVASMDGEELESVQQRAMRRLALAIVAGELAIEFGILPFALEEVVQSVMAIQRAWLGDADNEPECVRALRALRDFILRNEARFRSAADQRTVVRDLVGYIDTGRDLYLFTDQGIKDALHGYPWKAVLAELDRRGFLFKNEGARLNSRHHIAGKRRPRLFAIRGSLLEDELRKKT